MAESTKDLYPEQRRRQIVQQVNHVGRASVAELSQQFGVSEVTIRGDLQALAESNLLVRTHGGAVPLNNAGQYLSLAVRRQQQIQEKRHIGLAAARLVANGDAIILDSSSTALTIAQALKSHRYLTVITNGLMVAQEFLDTPDIAVVMPGGILRRDTASLVGIGGAAMLRDFNIQLGFFGAHGIAVAEGLTDVSPDEAEIKRPLVALCRQVVAVLDATKWGRVGVASFAALSQVHKVITDAHAPAGMVSQVRALGVEVILA
jgi:DeoR/GlpR family transcriptional regulator of sugar metabolism